MSELGTTYTFIGGNNKKRIGGSCSVVTHKHSKYNRPTRIMFDLGALFAPEYCLDVDAAIPDVREYLNSENSLASKKIDAMFISHAHEDHVGGYVHLLRAGFEMPPTYASKETLELLKSALIEAGIDKSKWPEMVEVKANEPIQFEGLEIEAINMSHSTIGALGYHTLTKIDDKVEAGIFHPGDYHLGDVRVGEGFNEKTLADLMKRKPVTHVILDSTSTASDDKFLVTHSEAVENTANVVNQHPEKQVISAVISRSIQNLAIDLDVARQTGRKIYLDGYWAKIAFKAMQNSGYHEFDDIVFKGSASEYKSKVPASKRYIITSGAFAESKKGLKSGLYKMSEQEKVKTKKDKKDKNPTETENQKLGHPDFVIDTNCLILARQRCIEEINGKQVRAMYNRLAALGATIVANESENPLGNYQTAKMQRSGHAVNSETQKMVKMILANQENPYSVIFIPTHGNSKQMINTNKAVTLAGGKFFSADNLDVLKLSKGEVKKVDELTSDFWIGVCEDSNFASGERTYTYTLVDDCFVVVEELKTVKKNIIRKNNSKNKTQKFNKTEYKTR